MILIQLACPKTSIREMRENKWRPEMGVTDIHPHYLALDSSLVYTKHSFGFKVNLTYL